MQVINKWIPTSFSHGLHNRPEINNWCLEETRRDLATLILSIKLNSYSNCDCITLSSPQTDHEYRRKHLTGTQVQADLAVLKIFLGYGNRELQSHFLESRQFYFFDFGQQAADR